MKHYHLALIPLIGLVCATAKADLLTIVLDSPTLSGSPGGVLEFSGTLTNTASSNLYLNADNFNLAGFEPSAINDSPFFTNAPLFLGGPDGSTGDIGLFNITIPVPFVTGNYGGALQVLGGVDVNAQDVVGSADFTVQVQQPAVVPEPASFVTLSLALLLLVLTLHARRAVRW
jgi:hypothetical protein